MDKNLESLEQFLGEWYGPPARSKPPLLMQSAAPEVLLGWNSIRLQWDHEIIAQNYPIPLDELTSDGDLTPFWVENQGGWMWAFDSHLENFVYDRDMSNPSNDWEPTGETLEEFLVHATVVEALLGAPAQKSATAGSGQWILSHRECRILSFRPWGWPTPGATLARGENWLCMIRPSQTSVDSQVILLGANALEDLAWVDHAPETIWSVFLAAETIPT
ncbi:hypothetical protein [Kitasatospora purpeofusca]|uniref:hypothetical protein n=1 Tax=Kitasatospora purpeofusca TaxID=67352 RepID=UPI0036D25573